MGFCSLITLEEKLETEVSGMLFRGDYDWKNRRSETINYRAIKL